MRPAYAAGVRAALAVVAPVAASMLLGLPGGIWMGIAGLNGVFADRGGSYRARAEMLAAMTCASAALAVVATMAGGRLALAVPLAFLVATGVSLTRAWGAAWVGAGVPVLLTFLVALSFPVDGARAGAALERAGFILLGGGWAMLLTLALWPLRPYRPVRLAVALCYRELAEHVAEIARRIAAREPLGADLLAVRATAVRRAVEQAREVLASSRRSRPGETGRGARLLALHEIADRIFVHVVAIADTVETVVPEERDAAGPVVLTALLADVADTLRALADATEAERSDDPVPVAWSGEALRAPEGAVAARPGIGEAHHAHVAMLLDRMAELAAAAASTAAGLESGRYGTVIEPGTGYGQRGVASTAMAALRAVLAPDSLLLRYSLRLGLVTAVAVGLTALLGLPYGYWITITAVVILQPYTGATTQRAIQRILGTILGGMVAAGLSALFHDPAAILVLVALFVALCVALLPLSYAAFSVFVTPAFVLLVEVGVGDWGLAWIRVMNTVLGGVLALVAARLLWPEPEWNRLPTHLAAALRASGEYLRVVASVLTSPPDEGATGRLRESRRQIGLAAINAEESFQRLLGEYGGAPARLEPAMAILADVRQLANSVAALALLRHSREEGRVEEVTTVAGMAGLVLDELATSLADGRVPAPLPERPPLAGPSVAPLLHARLERLMQQLEALHHAVTRWTTDGGATDAAAAPRGFSWRASRRSGRGGAPGGGSPPSRPLSADSPPP